MSAAVMVPAVQVRWVAGGRPLRLLSMASAEPSSALDLMTRLDSRGDMPLTHNDAYTSCRRLRDAGMLRDAGRGTRSDRRLGPKLYALTPEGEDLLDEMWERTA